MKDTLTSQNYQDFRQRYRGTYGMFAVLDKAPVLVRLIDVDEEEVRFEDARGGVYNVRANSGIPFEFFSIERCLFNSPDGVLYSRRKPARQWSRGVCSANTTITNLTTDRDIGVHFSNITHLFKAPETYKEYTESFLKGKIQSVALNHRFAILNGKVMMFDTPIGEYADFVAKVDELYLQEFTDLIKRNNLEIRVK